MADFKLFDNGRVHKNRQVRQSRQNGVRGVDYFHDIKN